MAEKKGDPRKKLRDVYRFVHRAGEGSIVVQTREGCYLHVDLETGKPLYNKTFAFAQPFSEGKAGVRDGWGYEYHIDKWGNAAYLRHAFTRVGSFSNEAADVNDENGAFHIDPSGEALYPERYSEARPFREGRAAVRELGKGWCFIRKDGEAINDEHYAYVSDFDGKGYAEVFYRGKTYLIDLDGKRELVS